MSQHIGALTLLVADYDQAIRFFTEGLGFALLEDTRLDEPGKPGKRWVRVAPKGASGSALLLAQAANAQQQTAIGQQGGGRVFLFLETTDFWGDYQRMQAYGVHFCEQPRDEPYGTVVVFEDISGNRWDLLQRTAAN
ncbi:VOC family protein [Aeromonas veronii]|uniref:VOC family protein n=1 Tax=Aeromonas veronii TaxID=654 RepID=UPI000C2929B8|nr:VOC family protein [Aeromonas veronii]ATY82116.1 glyoxalase [Aeromonas veronii]MBL0455177.1 VOC family protein [Aeromonas veronii]MDX7875342.1 VOC family protein [Aeromonas veronii]HDZ8836842.1 VOC family protein [Aeromonas veronii]HDZ8980919.1 VOC family protein [Aeromonas veronii]